MFVLRTYWRSPITTTADSLWSLHLVTSLLNHGDLNLDEYRRLIGSDDYRVEERQGHLYSTFPSGTTFVAAPILAILDTFPTLTGRRELTETTLQRYLATHEPDAVIFQVEQRAASLIVALNVLAVFALARRYLPVAQSIALSAIFAFATPAWSVASRALWQHGPSMLCLTVTLLLLIAASEHPALSAAAAVPLAFSYVVRPTNAISIVVLTAYVLAAYRQYVGYFTLGLLAVLCPFAIHNYSTYQSLLPPYYAAQRLTGLSFGALAGNLVSPSRGLLIFSPIFVFSAYGVYPGIGGSETRIWSRLELYIGLCVVLHWIAISAFPHWYGGWTIGPRFFTDMVPYLCFLIVPVVRDVAQWRPSSRPVQTALAMTFTAALAFSVFVHYRGANVRGPFSWNGVPIDVDKRPQRLWDWTDMQGLRGLCGDDVAVPRCWLARKP